MVRMLQEIRKQTEIYRITDAWLFRKEENYSMVDDLVAQGIKNVAIYGMSKLGQHLVTELEGTEIEIRYVIDRNPNAWTRGYQLYGLKEKLPIVDAVIVTVVGDYEKICENLKTVIQTKIITISELF